MDFKFHSCVDGWQTQTGMIIRSLPIYMALVLRNDGSNSVQWWVDASYKVHPNMHGHTGVTVYQYTVVLGNKRWWQED